MPTTTLEFKATDRQAQAAFDNLQRELKQTESETRKANREFDDMQTGLSRTRRGASGLTTVLGSMKGAIAGLGIAVVSRELLDFGAASVRAAGQMEGLRRGLEAIEGDNATQRLRDFNEIAKLPGLNTPGIIRYSNSLRAAGATAAEVDAIITTFGQAIVGLGGNAADTSRAMLQLTQAFGENKISQENFSTIKELIPNFNRLAKEVFNTDGSMDSLNQTFQASGQTLGTFLLPLLARIREEIPAAPVDSYARSMDALGEEFEQFKIAIGDSLLPAVSAGARGFAEIFDELEKGTRKVQDFFDVVDEQHHALLNATDSAREFAVRLADITQATGQAEAVDKRIQTLYRLRTALRTEQSGLSQSSKEYLQYAERIRDVNNELDTLRNIQGTAQTDNRAQLITVRTETLERTNAEIQRYTQLLENARDVAVGDTNPAIQQLERSLQRSQATAASLKREIELLTNGFGDLNPATETATADLTNYSLALARLKAEAEDTQDTLRNTAIFSPEVTPNFQAAIAASNAYYAERIRQAQTALASETEGTEAYNNLQTRIFELRRARQTEETRLQEALSQIVIARTQARQKAETDALKDTGDAYREYRQILNSVIEIQQQGAFRTYIERLRQQALTFEEIVPHAREYLDFLKQIDALPSVSSPDAQAGVSQLQQSFQDARTEGESLLDVMRRIVNFQIAPFENIIDVDIADLRQQQIDADIAAQVARGGQTLGDIEIDAYQQGLAFIRRLRSDENVTAERELQASLREQQRHYRQWANQVSRIFEGVATGRIDSFEEVAQQFIAYSLRIVSRAVIENTILKGLDTDLTNAKIANLNRVAQAGLASNLGLPNLGNIGNLLSGGGTALGVSALLFSNESRNLLSGIKSEISGFLENIGDRQEVVVQANIQNNLRIGDNEAREISDLTAELREEQRA